MGDIDAESYLHSYRQQMHFDNQVRTVRNVATVIASAPNLLYSAAHHSERTQFMSFDSTAFAFQCLALHIGLHDTQDAGDRTN